VEVKAISGGQAERCPHLCGNHQSALLTEYHRGIHSASVPRSP
jgi:hypothetical protein